jgi:hypothetical protein
MAELTVTVNGRAYYLIPQDMYETNPDYVVQLVGGNFPCGFLEWRGNGTTTFNYQSYDTLEQTQGLYDNYTDALTALDNELHPGG